MSVAEFALIDKIRQRAAGGRGLRLGIGDDCSSIEIPAGDELLTSTDLLLEDIHFRLDWTDPFSLGIKTVAVNLSDIAAMGARPLCVHLGFGLPARFEAKQLDQFLDGFFAALKRYDVYLAGGDTCRSNGPLMISLSVQGLCPRGQMVRRSGAASGEDLWVSGTLGDSALALKFLSAAQPLSPFLAEKHFRPVARIELGQHLAARGLATAMLDISDGLSGDLSHLLEASAVAARVDIEQLPLSAEFKQALQDDPALLDLALCGGEDYELLFTAKRQSRGLLESLSDTLSLPLQRIGAIGSGRGLIFCEAGGREYKPQLRAFDHFRASKEEEID